MKKHKVVKNRQTKKKRNHDLWMVVSFILILALALFTSFLITQVNC